MEGGVFPQPVLRPSRTAPAASESRVETKNESMYSMSATGTAPARSKLNTQLDALDASRGSHLPQEPFRLQVLDDRHGLLIDIHLKDAQSDVCNLLHHLKTF
ncbi:unnamed protein product [Symbiodinium natans]|uniref:Uncharacterized protein n=1 Tax=Symbiodinium natans TaxID=878477 RepID=A0A812UX60_9DINO|nr:unnamed protein product [Symbiodinium natans]